MDHLREPERSEALVLLGEALQNGRDAESIPFLEQVASDAPLNSGSKECACAYRAAIPHASLSDEQGGCHRQMLEEGQKGNA